MTSTSGPTVSGPAVIHSETLVEEASAPDAAKRTRSRSVMIPIGRAPSTTTTEPTRAPLMRPAAWAIVSEVVAVTGGLLITSPTVRVLAPGASTIYEPPSRSATPAPGSVVVGASEASCDR